MKPTQTIDQRCEQHSIEIVIGVETHVTLATKHKLMCRCLNQDGQSSNTTICEICTGQPGAMPVLNTDVLEIAHTLGHALSAQVNQHIYFDRKHYEYPDSPANFQRTQYHHPVITQGTLSFYRPDGSVGSVDVSHAHLEEDAGKLTHISNATLVDYNRAGRPLIEIVTSPTIHTSSDVIFYLEQLYRTVKVLGISEGDMQKGYFKSDISISLRYKGHPVLNPRTEIKNLNSFKHIQQAVDLEITKQLDYFLEHHDFKTNLDTVLFDEDSGKLSVMRKKEQEADYRFMSEPNIPVISYHPEKITQVLSPFLMQQQLISGGVSYDQAIYLSQSVSSFAYVRELGEIIVDLVQSSKIFINYIGIEGIDKLTAQRVGEFIKVCQTKGWGGYVIKQTLLHARTNTEADLVGFAQELVVRNGNSGSGSSPEGQSGRTEGQSGRTEGQIVVTGRRGSGSSPEGQSGRLEGQSGSYDTSKISLSDHYRDYDLQEISFAWMACKTSSNATSIAFDHFTKIYGKIITVSGRIKSIRDHGEIVFIDLRANGQVCQIKCTKDGSYDLDEIARLKDESCIQIYGERSQRNPDDYNAGISLGEIEINAEHINILSFSQQVPFEIDKGHMVGDEVTMKYRYLHLRNDRVRDNIEKRYKITKFMRDYFDSEGFWEIETPLLTKGTDEGSREFIVPSRIHAGEFYVLPQAPQQFKQLLMTSGVDKYFQIARCFRDEDSRGDRQPEFTQVDVEMAFTNEKSVRQLIGTMIIDMIKQLYPNKNLLWDHLPEIPYQTAMDLYGCDKPDIRFELQMSDITHIVRYTNFNIFRKPIENGGIVKCIKVSGEQVRKISAEDTPYFTKSYKEQELISIVKTHGLGGLAYLEIENGELFPKMNVDKLGEDICWKIAESVGAQEGDTVFFAAHEPAIVNKALDAVRRELGRKLELYSPDDLALCRIVDFPMFEKNEIGGWTFTHNPFSMPKFEHLEQHLSGTDIGEILAQQYDIVLNGYEIGGGSIRSHAPHILKATYRNMGYDEEQTQHSIGHMLEAFGYGAPPHGGLALGLDRIVMILQNQTSIRTVIPFPKTGDGRDLLMQAPSVLDDGKVREMGVRVV